MNRATTFLARRREATDERGFVLVWMAIVIFVLLGVAAFAVDLVHAYVEGERAQKAADAAALAGAVSVSKGSDADSIARAESLATDNGFTDSTSVSVTPQVTGPNEMTVQVKSTVDTFFARALGIDTLTVKRTGVAQYDAPVQMGSPANFVGSVPNCPGSTYVAGGDVSSCTNVDVSPYLWAAIQGPDSPKQSGIATSNTTCHPAATPRNVDGCSGNTNDEYDANGENFLIRTDGEELDLWIYDPAFVHQFPWCGYTGPAGTWPTTSASAWAGGTAAQQQVAAHWADTNVCPGDTTQSALSTTPMRTSYRLFAPQSMGSVELTECADDFGGYADPNLAFAGEGSDPSYLHQWKHMCSFGAGIETSDGDEYILNVRALSGQGTNQFAVLAVPTSGGVGDDIGVFTRKSLPMAAVNFGTGASDFYLARVLPSSQSRTLRVDFFDLGDSSAPGTAKSGTLAVGLKNATGTVRCEYTPAPFTTETPRFLPDNGTFTDDADCNFGYDAATTAGTQSWNSRWISLQITIPAQNAAGGYDCDTSDYDNCWLKLTIDPAGTSALNDATTWNADLDASPVRLVN